MQLFERVKEIFRKYGFTVTAIVLAAGTDIGAYRSDNNLSELTR